MPGRQQIPSFQLPSGTTAERDNSYNLTTVGNIFYNTDTSNVEIRHEDPSNNAAWRDLVVNNREEIDISGYLTLPRQPKLTNQPHFLISSNTSVPTNLGDDQIFPFNQTVLNPGSKFDVSTYCYEAPVSGFYRFTVKCRLRNSSFGNTRYVRPKVSTGGGWSVLSGFEMGVTPLASSSMTWIYELNQGDKIRIHNFAVVHQNGTSLWDFPYCYFMGELAFAN